MPIAAGIHYFVHNPESLDRPPVILIHGAGGTHLSWPADVRRLPGQRILAVDLPGHGRSAGLGRHAIPEYSQCLLDMLDELGIYKSILVGHSMGGAIAMDTALEHAERVLGLVMVASNARLRVATPILEALAQSATTPQAIQAILDFSFGPQADPSLKQLSMRLLIETRPAVLLGDLQACNSFDVIDRLSGINKPTLILCGTSDQMTPLRYAEFMASQIPGAALQTFDNAGHMLMLEEPHRVAGALNVFINHLEYIPGV